MKITKKELIDLVSEENVKKGTRIKKSAISDLIDSLGDVIKEQIRLGKKVPMLGLGTICKTDTKERQGRNPVSGEPMVIPASYRISFKSFKSFKDYIKMNEEQALEIKLKKEAKYFPEIEEVVEVSEEII